MHTVLAHHDHSDPNFDAHILSIRGNAFCIGCSASKLFMHVVLPLLLFSLGYLRSMTPTYLPLLLLFALSGILSMREMMKGVPHANKWLNTIPGIFQISALIFVAGLMTSIPLVQRLGIATLLSVPQLGIYLNKMIKAEEYFNTKIKYFARLLMIVGLFFATLDLIASPLISGGYIIASGLIFVKFRKFSGYRVGNDKVVVIHSFDNLVNSDQTLLVFVLFMIGLVSLASTGSVSSCDTSLEYSGLAFVPILATKKPNFCPRCGDPVAIDEKFCDKCGYNLLNPEKNVSPTRTGPAPIQYSKNQGFQQDPSYRGGRGQRSPRRSGLNEGAGMAIAAGVFVLLIGWFFTGSFGIGIIVGVLAFGGIMLAGSTNSCCAQYLIMDCCCDCICSIMGSSGRSRR